MIYKVDHFDEETISILSDNSVRKTMSSLIKLLFSLCCVLSTHILVEIVIFYTLTNSHCFLFAQIFEKERRLVPGTIGICEGFIAEQLMVVVASYLFAKYSHTYRKERKFLLCSCLVWCSIFVTAVIFTLGFQATCNSLNSNYTPICSSEVVKNFDWKNFVPKHVSGYHMVGHFKRIQLSLWLVVVLWFISTLLHSTTVGYKSLSYLTMLQYHRKHHRYTSC